MAKTCRITQLPWAVPDYAYTLLRNESLSLNAVAALLRERYPSAVPSRKTLRNARIQCRAQVTHEARAHQQAAEVAAGIITIVAALARAVRECMEDAERPGDEARH